jgi:hypothetical protein
MVDRRRRVNHPPTFPTRIRLNFCHLLITRGRVHGTNRFWRQTVESHGTLGTIWASFGMTAYYMALIWINILLGLFLSPLFMIPLTWLQDRKKA